MGNLTIDQSYGRDYVKWVQDAQKTRDVLKKAYLRMRREGDYKDALWAGHYAVKLSTEKLVSDAVGHGLLLCLVPA